MWPHSRHLVCCHICGAGIMSALHWRQSYCWVWRLRATSGRSQSHDTRSGHSTLKPKTCCPVLLILRHSLLWKHAAGWGKQNRWSTCVVFWGSWGQECYSLSKGRGRVPLDFSPGWGQSPCFRVWAILPEYSCMFWETDSTWVSTTPIKCAQEYLWMWTHTWSQSYEVSMGFS